VRAKRLQSSRRKKTLNSEANYTFVVSSLDVFVNTLLLRVLDFHGTRPFARPRRRPGIEFRTFRRHMRYTVPAPNYRRVALFFKGHSWPPNARENRGLPGRLRRGRSDLRRRVLVSNTDDTYRLTNITGSMGQHDPSYTTSKVYRGNAGTTYTPTASIDRMFDIAGNVTSSTTNGVMTSTDTSTNHRRITPCRRPFRPTRF
jgi:hypothetical protein